VSGLTSRAALVASSPGATPSPHARRRVEEATTAAMSPADAGSAIVEFCLLAVLLLVPIVYLTLALGRIQAGAFAAQGAAREAGRAFVTATDEASAQGRADAAAAIAFADQGFSEPSQVGIDVICAASPCLTPDERVVVRSRVLVVLPGVPRLVDRFFPARVEVTARHVSTVDRFRSR
jgi:RES domain-containing protein